MNTTVTRMMPHADLCVASGCHQRAKGYSRFCTKHIHLEQAHGHELQVPITPSHLRDPIERLTKWEKTPEGRKAIDAAVDHYVTLAERKMSEYSEDIREMYRTGLKWSSPRHQTTQIIAEVYQSKDPRKTVIELLAMGILLEESEAMFRSDRAFLCQVTHTFLRRSAAKQKFRFRPRQGRPIASTKYLSRKTRDELGRWLCREVVYFGVSIFRQWQRDAAEEKQGRAKVYAAIRGEAVAA